MAYYYLHRFFLRDLYQPHTWYTFDGPYTRLQMDDGSSFIFIMSSVWRARKNPFLCHLSYSPLPSTRTHRDPNEIRAFNCNFYPRAMGVTRRSQHDKDGVAAFTLSAIVPSSEVPGRPKETGTFQYEVEEEVQRYNHTFCHPQDGTKMDIQVDITDNTPHSVLGPMWIARFLPVPLKWHIFSTRSRALVTVKDSESGEVLLKKKGLAHQEKNWGLGGSYPAADPDGAVQHWVVEADEVFWDCLLHRLSRSMDLVSRLPHTPGQGLPRDSGWQSDLFPHRIHAGLSFSDEPSQVGLWARADHDRVWEEPLRDADDQV